MIQVIPHAYQLTFSIVVQKYVFYIFHYLSLYHHLPPTKCTSLLLYLLLFRLRRLDLGHLGRVLQQALIEFQPLIYQLTFIIIYL